MSQQSTGLSDGERKQTRREQQLILAASSTDPEALMDTRLICLFFGGRSAMTLSRWRHHPDPERRFPAPDMHVGVTPYWYRKTVIAYRDRVAKLPRKSLAFKTWNLPEMLRS
jgi:hypothetical protein